MNFCLCGSGSFANTPLVSSHRPSARCRHANVAGLSPPLCSDEVEGGGIDTQVVCAVDTLLLLIAVVVVVEEDVEEVSFEVLVVADAILPHPVDVIKKKYTTNTQYK